MSNSKCPRISIGIPVYNGERYLKQALDSLLSQTYGDFELIISDNASTDSTEQICRYYASMDKRIRYYRNTKNQGCPHNFNRVFALSTCEYFKWAAYDDLHSPDYLERCIKILDQDKTVVLCHSKTGRIDENGTFLGNYDGKASWRINSSKVHERFADLIRISYPKGIIYGVARKSAISKTRLLGKYIGADRNLVSEIGLAGRIVEVPEFLFFRRDHPDAYTHKFCNNAFATSLDKIDEQSTYWSADSDATNYPNWKDFAEFFRSLNHMPLKYSDRLRCYDEILRWLIKEGWIFLTGDLKNLLLRKSKLARRIIPIIEANLKIAFRIARSKIPKTFD